MIAHIHPETGMPVFVYQQIAVIPDLKAVYDKYGIHGINYCFMYGWSGSPFATITDDKERHDAVDNEVYEKKPKFYDPVLEQEVGDRDIKLRKKTNQYSDQLIISACEIINKLARVPVLEDKKNYLSQQDVTQKRLNNLPADDKEASTVQKNFLSSAKVISIELDRISERERNILAKKDYKASLDDFMTLQSIN